MSSISIVVIAVLAAALVVLAVIHFSGRRRGSAERPSPRARRILFPYIPDALSRQALDAALRIAIAQDATLVPVILAQVPMYLPLDAPLPRQSQICLPLQDTVEQVATEAGVPVDARIERGRTYRHALHQAIAHERFDWILVAAATDGNPGFEPDDIAWLLNNAPGEIVVMRPGQDRRIPLVRPRHAPRKPKRPINREYETVGSR